MCVDHRTKMFYFVDSLSLFILSVCLSITFANVSANVSRLESISIMLHEKPFRHRFESSWNLWWCCIKIITWCDYCAYIFMNFFARILYCGWLNASRQLSQWLIIMWNVPLWGRKISILENIYSRKYLSQEIPILEKYLF